MDKKQVFVGIVGGLAFIIGGIVARENAMDAVNILDKKFSKKEETPELESDSPQS